jgi:hypothetical protein
VLALLSWLLVAADPSPPTLQWSAAPGCPDEARGRARVEAFLGRPLAEVQGPELEIEVAIVEEGDAFVARIHTRTSAGPRSRHLPPHRDCALVGEAAALVVAMAIDPDVVAEIDEAQLDALRLGTAGRDAEPDAAALSPATEPPPRAAPPTTSARSSNESRSAAGSKARARARPFALVRATADAGWGRLPGVDLGTTLAVGIGWTRLRAEVLGAFVAPRRVGVGGGDARFFAWAVGARIGAAAIDRARVELPIMAGVDVGQIRARGVGLPDTRSARPVVVYARLGPGLRVRLHPVVALAFELELLVPFARPSFSVQGHGEVFQLPPAGVRGALGLEVRLPGRPGDGSAGSRRQTL